MMALGRARVLYLEQPLAVFLCYVLKRAFPIVHHSFSKTQLARQRLSFGFIETEVLNHMERPW